MYIIALLPEVLTKAQRSMCVENNAIMPCRPRQGVDYSILNERGGNDRLHLRYASYRGGSDKERARYPGCDFRSRTSPRYGSLSSRGLRLSRQYAFGVSQ